MLVVAYQKRDRSFELSILDDKGALAPITSSDIVYLKIGHNLETPEFELNSEKDSAAGSSMTKANPTRVVLKRADVLFRPGIYDCEVGFMDNSDSDHLKHATKHIFNLHGTQSGNTTRAEFAS